VAQHDYSIANQSGSSFRADLNNALSAVVSQNSGSAEPTTMFAYQMWADTTAGVMKLRNGANSAWITLYELDGTFVTTDIQLGLGAAATPSLTFTGDLNTGVFSPGADQVSITTGGTERVRFDAAGQIEAVSLGTAAAPTYSFTTDPNTGIYSPGADQVSIATNGTQRATVDASGRLLVGTGTARSPLTHSPSLQVEGIGFAASTASVISNSNDANGAYLFIGKSRGTSLGANTVVQSGDELGGLDFLGADGSALLRAARITALVDGTPGANDMPGRLLFSTTADGAASPTERMRIDSSGGVLINTNGGGSPTVANRGFAVFYGGASGDVSYFESYGAVCAYMNRNINDGEIIQFRQAGTPEGSISVSGTTISYNGAHLSRWSQLPSGVERTEILRGTVLTNLDEMCEWIDAPKETMLWQEGEELPEGINVGDIKEPATEGGPQDNEQLNRMKVSDVEGDKNVAGVFQAWDDDDDTYTDDFYCAMTGDFIIRIAEGVTVERGDLLMSAGDGTAKPQDDDIIRSKTIAKVTSTNVSCTYEDGSYCVPCVLMAC
jgi:hypothetical protein